MAFRNHALEARTENCFFPFVTECERAVTTFLHASIGRGEVVRCWRVGEKEKKERDG